MLCRRKQRQLQVQLQEVGDDALQERLQGAAERPANPPFRLSSLIQVLIQALALCGCL